VRNGKAYRRKTSSSGDRNYTGGGRKNRGLSVGAKSKASEVIEERRQPTTDDDGKIEERRNSPIEGVRSKKQGKHVSKTRP